ncbi:hypothetical protein CDD81_3740 [Ophiocordyceps australis]|uniref:Uncharacterized protein n=1 Tax=Ophiocordyceps australis TaxID=1399860 RepID=A0A2C5YB91_9HYPO|nr:hypothetical protein CDD81_3740 [Ophiocordyceps australis]
MVTKSKLRLAIAAEKGIDFKKLKLEKKHKEALKRKRAKQAALQPPNEPQEENDENGEEEDDDEQEWEDEEGQDADTMNLDAVDESDTSDSSIEYEDKISHKASDHKSRLKSATKTDNGQDDDQDEKDEDEDIPISDLEDLDDEDKEDLIPHTRLTINNTSALQAALDRIALPTGSTHPFAPHQSIVSAAPTADSITDVADDLTREVAFYAQCLDAVQRARILLRKEEVPFSRPGDYFAEMVKEDAHMEKIKAKLVEEAAAKKAATEARRLRDLKKFGKQVQVAKLQERQKAKRETLDKIKTLKRKRQESGAELGTNEADLFDVGVDAELAKHSQRHSTSSHNAPHKPNVKRQKKNEKFGFGGKKRHAKSGDAISSGDLSSFNTKKMRAGRSADAAKTKSKSGKAPRPGKARRKTLAKR